MIKYGHLHYIGITNHLHTAKRYDNSKYGKAHHNLVQISAAKQAIDSQGAKV
jgi:hypothetical protein